MSVEQFVQIAILALVTAFGLRILEKLPKTGTDPSFKFECPDLSIAFKVDEVFEKAFEIGFVDSWNVGRAFLIGGVILPPEDAERLKAIQEIFGTGERVAVNIYPTVDWFNSSAIGYLRTYNSLGAVPYIGLPYQLAYQVLSELRRDPGQIASFDFQREETAKGKEVWRIYNFELNKSL